MAGDFSSPPRPFLSPPVTLLPSGITPQSWYPRGIPSSPGVLGHPSNSSPHPLPHHTPPPPQVFLHSGGLVALSSITHSGGIGGRFSCRPIFPLLSLFPPPWLPSSHVASVFTKADCVTSLDSCCWCICWLCPRFPVLLRTLCGLGPPLCFCSAGYVSSFSLSGVYFLVSC